MTNTTTMMINTEQEAKDYVCAHAHIPTRDIFKMVRVRVGPLAQARKSTITKPSVREEVRNLLDLAILRLSRSQGPEVDYFKEVAWQYIERLGLLKK
jgi:hypothetical protein